MIFRVSVVSQSIADKPLNIGVLYIKNVPILYV
jgi:hypothetical protein